MASPWCRPILSLDFEFCILLLSCCALESTTQWRLSAIKVKLELECSSAFLLLVDEATKPKDKKTGHAHPHSSA